MVSSIDISGALATLAAFTYAFATLSGLPVLRHDWGADPFHSSWREILAVGFGGWDPSGIGRPLLYPDAYLICLPITLVTVIGGSRSALFVFLLAIGALAAFGGRAIAKDAGGCSAVASAAALFCIFNPWTYTELVAGHVFMLLAYAASIWFFRELFRPTPRPAVLVTTSLLTLQQPQFLAICTLSLAAFTLRTRTWLPLAIVCVTWLPIAIGLGCDSAALNTIPFLVSWEREQSISAFDALQLNGYFTGYAKDFGYFSAVPVMATAALAAGSLLRIDKRQLLLGAGTAAALLVAIGLRGPLAAPLGWLIQHTRLVAFYRELFDVLAYAAIGYVLLAVGVASRWKLLAFGWLLVMIILPVPWFVSPPFRFWVPASALPPITIAAPRNTRFALVPAFQPMSFGERGAGRDPDLRAMEGNVTPLNEPYATYPSNAALAAFLLHADARPLAQLSVTTIIERPWLRVDSRGLSQEWALPFGEFSQTKPRTILLRGAPELALLPVPRVGALDARIGSGNVFFGDAAGVHGPSVPAAWSQLKPVESIRASNQFPSAALGWVDARLAFAQRPELAQALGGALTTSEAAVLSLHGGLSTLVFVEGVLRSTEGRVLARTTHGYRWIPLPPNVTGVTCSGLCLVAAQGHPPSVPLEPEANSALGLPFRAITPWLVIASVPGGAAGALRYNVAYDAGWRAYLDGTFLTHVRLDGAVNGWLISDRGGVRRLLMFESTAAAEVLAEIVVLVALSWYAARTLRAKYH